MALLIVPQTIPRLYVRCNVLPGLFDSEYLVSFTDVSAFVARTAVRVAEQPTEERAVVGSVEAYCLGERADSALIELSGEPVVGSLRFWIPRAAIVQA
jgi:hypothetical protein